MPAQVTADQQAMQRFSQAVQQLGSMSGRHFEAVMRHELGAILTSAVRGTKKASVKTIRENARKRPGMVLDTEDYRGPESYTGKTYSESARQRLIRRANERRTRSPLIYYLPGSKQPKFYPNWVWREMQEKRERQLPELGLAQSDRRLGVFDRGLIAGQFADELAQHRRRLERTDRDVEIDGLLRGDGLVEESTGRFTERCVAVETQRAGVADP